MSTIKKIQNGGFFLHNKGILFEINRTVLHPLGFNIGIEKTEKTFSIVEVNQKGEVGYIESSLTLHELHDKFKNKSERLADEKQFGEKRKKKNEKSFFEIIEKLSKLEEKHGGKFPFLGSEFIITREKDGHKEGAGVKISDTLDDVREEEEGLTFTAKYIEKTQERFSAYLKKEGNIYQKKRLSKLGFIVQSNS